MTLLAVPIFGADIDEVRGRVAAALEEGAEIIELRADLMEGIGDDDIWTLRKAFPEAQFILTIRSINEGGRWDGPDDERVSRLIELGPMADYIDVELSLWRRSANIRQKIGLALSRAGHFSQAGGMEAIEFAKRRKLILSRHHGAGGPLAITGDLVEMLSADDCAVPKLAWSARSVRDNFDALEFMRDSKKPAIIICMGEDGLASRVLARKFGAFCSFAAMEGGLGTAPGQLTLRELKDRYGWDRINQATRVYGVIGDPVAQSLGPTLHNAGFREVRFDGVYLPFRVIRSFEAFKAFMVEVLARPWLDAGGFSVTAPHKENARRFIDERGGRIDDFARKVRAVNTIVIGKDGALAGFNTDGPAVLEAILNGWVRAAAGLSGMTAVVLGAGGMARATAHILLGAGVEVIVCNRTSNRAEELAREAGCLWREWSDRGELTADLLINCTSVGMMPRTAESPMPRGSVGQFSCVVETIYRPGRTRLLIDAEASGTAIIQGQDIFIVQAIQQFRHWTGEELKGEKARALLAAALAGEAT